MSKSSYKTQGEYRKLIKKLEIQLYMLKEFVEFHAQQGSHAAKDLLKEVEEDT
jgi:hypothetical protein